MFTIFGIITDIWQVLNPSKIIFFLGIILNLEAYILAKTILTGIQKDI